jgi:hypothetical protein
MDAAVDGSRVEVQEVTSVGLRGRLFRKYAVVLAGLVSVALIANGLLDIWFSYREQRALLVRIQAEQAATAAARISHFVTEIEGQMGWTTQMAWNPGDIQQRRLEALASATPSARDHRTLAPRRLGPRAAQGFAPCHGRSEEWDR